MKTTRKLAMVAILTIVLALGGYVVFSFPASLPLAPRAQNALRLTIANINFENTKADTLAKTLLKTESDLFVLFEWTGNNLNLNELKNQGFTVLLNEPRPGTHGVCVITKYPGVHDARLLDAPIQGPCVSYSKLPVVNSI